VCDCGLVEGKEDRTEENCRLVIGVGLEIRVNVDDEGRADCREQTRLRGRVKLLTVHRLHNKQRTNIKVVLRSSSYFLT
jgi:hypothetical protein